jgi:hypothetical protein
MIVNAFDNQIKAVIFGALSPRQMIAEEVVQRARDTAHMCDFDTIAKGPRHFVRRSVSPEFKPLCALVTTIAILHYPRICAYFLRLISKVARKQYGSLCGTKSNVPIHVKTIWQRPLRFTQ